MIDKNKNPDFEVDLYAMFGDDDEDKAPPKAYQKLAGLKLSGSYFNKINLDGKDIDVPTLSYVRVLEEQIRELRKELRLAQRLINRLLRDSDKNNTNIRNLNNYLSSKSNNME